MNNNWKYYIGIVFVALLFVLANSVYIVNQAEQAIVLQFGEPVRLVKEPGLKFKIPFIQNVTLYDTRLLNLDPPAQEVVLNDKKRLDVDSFTRYKIVDPLKFYQTVRTEPIARGKLEEIVNSSVRKILGRITLQELLSQQRTEIMRDISNAVKVDAAQIGVSVADVRIRRADLPAQQIRAKADKERTIIIAEAEKQAQITRGQGDETAIKIWNDAAGTDPEFYAFYRSLEAYKTSLGDGEAELVLSPDSEFFNYFGKSMKTGR